VLAGSNRSENFRQPSGYDAVELIGTPQETKEGHPEDGIVAALEMAWTHRYSAIFFNRSYTTITQGLVQSLRRSDVVGVAREGFNSPFGYFPHESLSNGQTREDRQMELPNYPTIAPFTSRKPDERKKTFDS
jgi:hypothetical protein